MTTQQQNMIVGDFEKYMRFAIRQQQGFTLEHFVSFASSLINFYQGSSLLTGHERRSAALLLVQSFNAGIGNRISAEDREQISDLIISETTVDYSILSPIFA